MSAWKTADASAASNTKEALTTAQISSSTATMAESRTLRGLRGFCAGAVGGAVTTTILSPIDVARSRIMVQGTAAAGSTKSYTGLLRPLITIWQEEGIRGWFQGYRAGIIMVPLFWSIYFPIYDAMRQTVVGGDLREKKPTVLQNMYAGCAAGAICDVVMNPFWVVRTRLQTQHMRIQKEQYKSVFDAFAKIYRDEGFLALYKGLGASLLGLTHVAVQFPTYEYMKERLGETSYIKSPFDIILASAGSKIVASSVTYPHEVIRARLQVQRGYEAKFGGIFDVAYQAIKNEGVSALFKGMALNLMRVTPACVLTFTTYEVVMKISSPQ